LAEGKVKSHTIETIGNTRLSRPKRKPVSQIGKNMMSQRGIREEVLIRVRAASVAPWDALVRTRNSGLCQTYPLILDSEISGIVETVGPDAANPVAGDEAFGATNPSSSAAMPNTLFRWRGW
jgi:NADPH:quinone reductase-like Zn-dependent oxidoreductase